MQKTIDHIFEIGASNKQKYYVTLIREVFTYPPLICETKFLVEIRIVPYGSFSSFQELTALHGCYQMADSHLTCTCYIIINNYYCVITFVIYHYIFDIVLFLNIKIFRIYYQTKSAA